MKIFSILLSNHSVRQFLDINLWKLGFYLELLEGHLKILAKKLASDKQVIYCFWGIQV